MAVTHEAVNAAASSLGFELEQEQCAKLAAYLEQLEKWNRKMNLVGPKKWRTVFETLIVDSLHLADFIAGLEQNNHLPTDPLTLDFGAGAGLPGIPLRILWDKGAYKLIEVRQKRVTFMRSTLGRIKPGDTEALECRAEDALETLQADHADLILSRAFMPWKQLLELVHPMLSDTKDSAGVLIILSNDPMPEELPAGWKGVDSMSYDVGEDTRYFWALQRESA